MGAASSSEVVVGESNLLQRLWQYHPEEVTIRRHVHWHAHPVRTLAFSPPVVVVVVVVVLFVVNMVNGTKAVVTSLIDHPSVKEMVEGTLNLAVVVWLAVVVGAAV